MVQYKYKGKGCGSEVCLVVDGILAMTDVCTFHLIILDCIIISVVSKCLD